ncbi:MAG: hypothetical protein JWN62_64, partial [Acidimicrobiales bacterium]|nr:hypothetical protein [Acidimicrobiales bacterium]
MSGDSSAVAGLATRRLSPGDGQDPLDRGEIGRVLQREPRPHGASRQRHWRRGEGDRVGG